MQFLLIIIIIKLVDTASLSIIDQISIMRKIDYLIGVHGADYHYQFLCHIKVYYMKSFL